MEDYIGVVRLFAGNFVPQNWAFCNGATIPVALNRALFSIIGNMYGGDGVTTFCLPNLAGCIVMNAGTNPGSPISPLAEGSVGGSSSVILNKQNMPSHTHVANVQGSATLLVNSSNASLATPTSGSSIAAPGFLTGTTFNATLGFNTATPDTKLNSASVSLTTASVTNQSTGNNAPIDIMPPYVVLNYIICTMGMYPSPGAGQ
jgi:microcystin-dependent protein